MYGGASPSPCLRNLLHWLLPLTMLLSLLLLPLLLLLLLLKGLQLQLQLFQLLHKLCCPLLGSCRAAVHLCCLSMHRHAVFCYRVHVVRQDCGVSCIGATHAHLQQHQGGSVLLDCIQKLWMQRAAGKQQHDTKPRESSTACERSSNVCGEEVAHASTKKTQACNHQQFLAVCTQTCVYACCKHVRMLVGVYTAMCMWATHKFALTIAMRRRLPSPPHTPSAARRDTSSSMAALD